LTNEDRNNQASRVLTTSHKREPRGNWIKADPVRYCVVCGAEIPKKRFRRGSEYRARRTCLKPAPCNHQLRSMISTARNLRRHGSIYHGYYQDDPTPEEIAAEAAKIREENYRRLLESENDFAHNRMSHKRRWPQEGHQEPQG
jgi:hypothetical protein